MGAKAGHPCVFPFNSNGKTCPGPKCCNLDNSAAGSWCSTKVDSNGNHVSGNYARCAGSPCDPGLFIIRGQYPWEGVEHKREGSEKIGILGGWGLRKCIDFSHLFRFF